MALSKEQWEKIADTMRAFIIPLDLDQLESDGVIEKARKGYRVLDAKRLPHNARVRIKSFTLHSDGEVASVTFDSRPLSKSKAKDFKAFLKKFDATKNSMFDR